ncbi:MAG: hypothetical protein JW944_13945 [Deltaproteobacteria bacterium]|nr:hypothetical protein [Deltaproteobacteria bacterium]
MTATAQSILDKVLKNFGTDHLLGAIVYLDCIPVSSGEYIQAGDIRFEVPWDAHIAFIDLEPQRTFGHDCCYLAIRRDGDEVIRIETNMPPSIRDGKSSFHLLWHGPLAPERDKIADYGLTPDSAVVKQSYPDNT